MPRELKKRLDERVVDDNYLPRLTRKFTWVEKLKLWWYERIRKNSALSGASYSDIDAGVSVMEVDSSATIVANGTRQLGIGFGKSDSVVVDLEGKSFYIDPGDKITITQKAGSATVTGSVSLNWEELH